MQPMVDNPNPIFPTPATGPAPAQDGRLLHFLIRFPPWCILMIVLAGLLTYNIFFPADFLPRLIDQAFGGLLATLVQSLRAGTTTNNTVQADNVQTDQVRTDSMDNAEITAENVTTSDSQKKPEQGDI